MLKHISSVRRISRSNDLAKHVSPHHIGQEADFITNIFSGGVHVNLDSTEIFRNRKNPEVNFMNSMSERGGEG